jgi:rare lipoprotein A
MASWYGPGFHGQTTANGERFDQDEFTAAHQTLPFGTKVLVKNPRTGKQVVVRINDRGPFVGGRIIDLSKAAAKALGMLRRGHDIVVLHALAPNTPDTVIAALHPGVKFGP